MRGIKGAFLCSEGSRAPRSNVQLCRTARGKPGARPQAGLPTSQQSGREKQSVITHVFKGVIKNAKCCKLQNVIEVNCCYYSQIRSSPGEPGVSSARPHGARSLGRERAPPWGLRWQQRLTSLAPALTVPLSLETGVPEAGLQSHRLSSAISASSWGLLLPLVHKARASMRAPSSQACLMGVPSTRSPARTHRRARRNSCQGYLLRLKKSEI